MSHQFQTLSALLLVAIAATWLALRAVARRKKPGCGGDCGCAPGDLRATVSRREKESEARRRTNGGHGSPAVKRKARRAPRPGPRRNSEGSPKSPPLHPSCLTKLR